MNPYQWREVLHMFLLFFSGTVIITGVLVIMMGAIMDA